MSQAAVAPTTEDTKIAFEITDDKAKQVEVPDELIDEIEEEIYNYLDNLDDDDVEEPLDETEHNVVKRSPHRSYYKGYHGYNRGRSYHRPTYGHKRHYGGRHYGRRNSGIRKLIKGIVVASVIKGALLG